MKVWRSLAFLGPLSLGLALCLISPRTSEAKGRVAVVALKGKSAAGLTKQIETIVKKSYRLASRKKVRKYAKRKRYRRSPGRLARKVGADLVITGSVKRVKIRNKRSRKVKRRYRLILTFTDRGGDTVGELKLYLRQRSLRTSKRRKVLDELEKHLDAPRDRENRIAKARDDEERESRVRKRKKKKRKKKRRKKRRRSRDDDDDDDDDGDAPTVRLSEEQQAEYSRRGRAVAIDIGASLGSRTLDFNTTSGIADPPQGYSGFPFGGLRLDAEIFPFAFDKATTSVTKDLGLTATYDAVLLINSELAEQPGVELKTTYRRWGVGLAYRLNLGEPVNGTQIKFVAGYNRLMFELDRSNVPAGVVVDVPNVDYTYIDPGAYVRHPLSYELAIMGGARALLVTKSGNVGDAMQYGQARVIGARVDGGIEYLYSESAFIQAEATMHYFGFKFDGNGTLTDRDNDGTPDVGGARDLFLALFVSAGYLF